MLTVLFEKSLIIWLTVAVIKDSVSKSTYHITYMYCEGNFQELPSYLNIYFLH